MRLPRLRSKNNRMMLVIFPVFSFVTNISIFGWRYLTDWKILLSASLLTVVISFLYYVICSFVVVAFKDRFPSEDQVMKRLASMIISFLLIGGLMLYVTFVLFSTIAFFKYEFDQASFIWVFFALGILNIFVTFLMEGMSRYRAWEKNRNEAEDLNRVYKQSQLQGLKSQVNSHFLFNSLNTLSSLINEQEEEAEKFLDEMSKVYRYLLRNDDQQFVTLATELKFTRSYMHLLSARFGKGIHFEVDVAESSSGLLMAPLTLQVIIENTFSQNIINISSPLRIYISTVDNRYLVIKHNIQPKTMTGAIDFESGLDNLITKYHLLSEPVVVTEEHQISRTITVPLLTTNLKEVNR